jgi:hypothetical protein
MEMELHTTTDEEWRWISCVAYFLVRYSSRIYPTFDISNAESLLSASYLVLRKLIIVSMSLGLQLVDF